LKEIYGRMASKELKVEFSKVELAYDRINNGEFQDKLNVNKINENRINELKIILLNGNVMTKYCTDGKPEQRYVFIDQMIERVFWCKASKNELKKKFDLSSSVSLDHIFDVELGHDSTEILKKSKVAIEHDRFCFSLVAFDRSYDFRCSDIKTKTNWVQFIRYVIEMRKMKERKVLISQSK